MEVFLNESKVNVQNINESSKINVVLGNESCDLDSAVSSIVYAYFLHQSQQLENIVIPVVNVKREDLPTKTEVVYFLEETSIMLESLVCIDEIDLQGIHSRDNLNLILVDHNRLQDKLSNLSSSISQIIDHHVVNKPEDLANIQTKIEMVGSCNTLIAEEIFNSKLCIMDPQIAMLLYGTILTDTLNLSESAKKATPKDKLMVSKLLTFLEGIDPDEVYEMLQKVKYDVSNLSPKQLLQKDTKLISDGNYSIAIASLPMLLQDIPQNDIFMSDLCEMATSQNLTSIILLGTHLKQNGKDAVRQIGVYDAVPKSLESIIEYLSKLEHPSLRLKSLPVVNKCIRIFDQENSVLGRKFVLPAMQNYLKNLNSGSTETEKLSNSVVNGDTNENSLFPEDEEEFVPTYQAEPLDFPESPNHSRLLQNSFHQQTPSSGIPCNVIQTPDELNLSTDSRNSTLKRIAVHPKALLSELPEEPLGDLDIEAEDQRSLSSLSNRSEVFSLSQDIVLDEDAETIDDDLDSDYLAESPAGSETIPEVSAAEEFAEERSWRSCCVGGEERRVDMKVIEPYRKVLSHGGYEGSNHNAIIVFSACYLPDRSRKDYDYVMDNLFLYVIVTLDELVAEDYVLVYLHGATERSAMPSFTWLKRCYQMIDRRLRKNLKGLYLVHPTFWLKTIVIMTRPFISSKFSRKLKFVTNLSELSTLVPLDHVCIPEKVKQLDFERSMREYMRHINYKNVSSSSPMYIAYLHTLHNNSLTRPNQSLNGKRY